MMGYSIDHVVMMAQTNKAPREWRGIESKTDAIETFLANPSRETLHEMLNSLWGTRTWTSVEYFLDENFLDEQTPKEIATTIREAAKNGEAYPVKELDGFGWATATEVLSAYEIDKFAILNGRAIEGIEALGYDTPNQDSASPEQYEEFSEKVKDAVARYPLREIAEEQMEEPAPKGTPDYLIADFCFACHSEDEYDLDLSEQKEDTLRSALDDEIISRIDADIEDDPMYRDLEDFIYSAIRNELSEDR